MWFTLIDTHEGRRIEARVASGVWQYRTYDPRTAGPHRAYDESTVSRPSTELAPHLGSMLGARPRNVHPAALAPLRAALARFEQAGADGASLQRWYAPLDRVEGAAAEFEAMFRSLRDLLHRLAAHIDRGLRGEHAASPETAFGRRSTDAQPDPELFALLSELLGIISARAWGEAASARDPAPSASRANHDAAIFGWRQANPAMLPFEDIDALIADRHSYVETLAAPTRVSLRPQYLLALLPRIDALVPFCDLRSSPGDDVTVASIEVASGAQGDQRTVSLVRNSRRWGLRVDAQDPVMLPAGIGAELAHGLALASGEPPPRSLALELLALADVLRLGHDPRRSFTAYVQGTREIRARWRRGAWQWRAIALRRHDGRWSRRARRTSWRRGVRGLLPVDLTSHGLPSYVHPVVAHYVRLAFENQLRTRGFVEVHGHGLERERCEYEDRVWQDLLAAACAGEIVRPDERVFTPEWVFATEYPYRIRLGATTWPSIDEAVAHGLRQSSEPLRWAHATLFAALEWKHTHDFVPAMVLRDTGDAPLVVPSRWDEVLGDNIVGRLLMQIRAANRAAS